MRVDSVKTSRRHFWSFSGIFRSGPVFSDFQEKHRIHQNARFRVLDPHTLSRLRGRQFGPPKRVLDKFASFGQFRKKTSFGQFLKKTRFGRFLKKTPVWQFSEKNPVWTFWSNPSLFWKSGETDKVCRFHV